MTRFPHLAQRLFNTPIAIHPAKAEVVMAALADRLGIARLFSAGQLVALRPQANQLIGDARVMMNAVGMVAPGLNRSFGRFAAGYRQALAPVTAANATTARALNGVAAARRGAARASGLVSGLSARL